MYEYCILLKQILPVSLLKIFNQVGADFPKIYEISNKIFKDFFKFSVKLYKNKIFFHI